MSGIIQDKMDDLIINFSPTGMVPTKEQIPFVPLSVTEIVESVLMAHEKGITIAHVHARDSEGRPTQNMEIYGKLITGSWLRHSFQALDL